MHFQVQLRHRVELVGQERGKAEEQLRWQRELSEEKDRWLAAKSEVCKKVQWRAVNGSSRRFLAFIHNLAMSKPEDDPELIFIDVWEALNERWRTLIADRLPARARWLSYAQVVRKPSDCIRLIG